MIDDTGIIIVTGETKTVDAIEAMVSAFYTYRHEAKPGETIWIEFTRRPHNIPENQPQEVIVTHRTPGPMVKVQNAFRAAWAKLNANQCMVVKFEIRPIYEPDDEHK